MRGRRIAAGVAVGTAIVGSLLAVPRGEVAQRGFDPGRAYEIPATQDIAYRVADRPPNDLDTVIAYVRTWMSRPAHRGDGYVIKPVPGMEWSRARSLNETLRRLHERLRKGEVDDYWAIMAVRDRFRMLVLKVDVNPTIYLPTEGTTAIDIIVGTTVTRFPNIQSAGIYVCRTTVYGGMSQHAYANAVDWVGSEALLDQVARWQVGLVRQGWLPASQILWEGRNLLSGHAVYDHYDHIHDSGGPLMSGPCRRAG